MSNFAMKAIEEMLFHKPELQLVSKLSFPWYDTPTKIYFPKEYLISNGLKNYSELPHNLTLGELYQLNADNNYMLRWALLKSSVSKKDIEIVEKKLEERIPKELRNYFQSYSLPISCVYGRFSGDWFRQTYDEETGCLRLADDDEDVVTTELQLFPMLKGNELDIFLECNYPYKGTGYIYVGTLNENYFLFVNSNNGQVICADEECIDETSIQSIQLSLESAPSSFIIFDSFEQLLKCYFEGYIFDLDSHQFNQR